LARIVRDEPRDARPAGCGGSQLSSKQEFGGALERDRSLRDQIAPDLVLIVNDAGRAEVGTVVQGVRIGDHDDINVI
jgi:hypothetical protein